MKEKFLSKKFLIKNVGIITICRGIGVFSGLILDAIILSKFGLGTETDAFFAAIAIPLIISRVIEWQAPNVLVPVFTHIFNDNKDKEIFRIIGNIITISVLSLFFLSLFGASVSGFIIPLQVPGFEPEVIKLSIALNMLLFWLLLIRGIDAMCHAVLYTYHHFLLPALSRVIINSVTIILVILLSNKYGIHALAYGFLFGGIMSVIFMISALSVKGFRYRCVCKFNDPTFIRTYKLILYPLGGNIISESKDLIENYLSSFLESGSLSALRYAFRIVHSITGVLVGGIVTATLPRVSYYTANKNFNKTKQSILEGIKILIIITLPLCIWLILTCEPMLSLLFERGQFTKSDVILISTIIVLMAPYIFFSRLGSLAETPFFAALDMKTPVISMSISFLSYIFVSFILFESIKVYVFPIAHSLSTFCAATYLCIMFHRKFGALGWKKLEGFAVRLIGAAVIMAFGMFLSLHINSFFNQDNLIDKIIRFAVPTLTGAIVLLISSMQLRVIDWKFLTNYKRKDFKDLS